MNTADIKAATRRSSPALDGTRPGDQYGSDAVALQLLLVQGGCALVCLFRQSTEVRQVVLRQLDSDHVGKAAKKKHGKEVNLVLSGLH